MTASGITTAAAVVLAVGRQAVGQGEQTVVWLALGAILGISYVLGTEKYVRAMQHRHVFVRLSMLFLSGCCWVCSAGAVCVVCVKIYAQTADSLEGFERVIGILLPAVVRADLIVDWAKRVTFSLLNVRSWVCACVQFQRIMARTASLRAKPELNISRDVQQLAISAYHERTNVTKSEREIWESDVSLVKTKEIMKHFFHLGRISIYGISVFVGAIPAGVLWIGYALFLVVREGRNRSMITAMWYFLSIPFTPFGVIFALIAAFGLVVGVVSLSVFGTLVQFFVYWAVRFVYSIVRIGLSEEYARFRIMKSVDDADNDNDISQIEFNRYPNEAAAAMARGGLYFPSELEFALSPWDGSISYDDERTCDKVDLPTAVMLDDNDGDNEDGGDGSGNMNMPKTADTSFYVPSLMTSNKSSDSSQCSELESEEQRQQQHMMGNYASMARELSMLSRMGMDRTNNTRRKRRLSSYYALSLMVNLQVESGGKGFCLSTIAELLTNNDFEERTRAFQSVVVEDVKVACAELAKRLKRMTRYRIIHCGTESDLVDVEQWLRAVVLFLLDSSIDTPGAVGLLVRQDNVRIHPSEVV